MFIKELTFECYRNTQYASVERAINNYFDMLRYNGQILGREFPIAMFAGWFVTRLVCPEENSLDEVFNSPQVKHALTGLPDFYSISSTPRLWSPEIRAPRTTNPYIDPMVPFIFPGGKILK